MVIKTVIKNIGKFILVMLILVKTSPAETVIDKKNRISLGLGMHVNPFASITNITHERNLSVEYERATGNDYSVFLLPRYVYYGSLRSKPTSADVPYVGDGRIIGKETILGLKYVVKTRDSYQVLVLAGYGIGAGKLTIGGSVPTRKNLIYRVAIVGIETRDTFFNKKLFWSGGAHLSKVFYSDGDLPSAAHDSFFSISIPTVQFKIGTMF